ncbi:MAG TPA: FkbM family methyltransferase [Solirubrobacterales bacterium]|nr:FkbM family methyltransferase [Solirubrobacterales bacterium]
MRARSLLHPHPAYVWRPSQIGRRLAVGAPGGRRTVTLPWGAAIEVDTGESVGSGIARLGVHEAAVTEAMWRLAEPTDLALDVGANIGYFTSLLASRARRVVALEAHPLLAERLIAEAARWPGRIEVLPVAASAGAGVARLGEPAGFARNAGTASIGLAAERTFEVRTVALDEVVGTAPVGICKMDVEGHEMMVLDGFREALAEGRVRDLFFEEHEPLPTPVSTRLTDHGYRVFSLRGRLDRVSLGPPAAASRDDAPTYLATLEPERARRRLRGLGWRSLRGRR